MGIKEGELFINGKKYLSSKICGARFGWTNDYVARLCRIGAVDGHFANRTWYAEETSLSNFQKAMELKKKRRYEDLSKEIKEGKSQLPRSAQFVENPRTEAFPLRYLSEPSATPILKPSTVSLLSNFVSAGGLRVLFAASLTGVLLTGGSLIFSDTARVLAAGASRVATSAAISFAGNIPEQINSLKDSALSSGKIIDAVGEKVLEETKNSTQKYLLSPALAVLERIFPEDLVYEVSGGESILSANKIDSVFFSALKAVSKSGENLSLVVSSAQGKFKEISSSLSRAKTTAAISFGSLNFTLGERLTSFIDSVQNKTLNTFFAPQPSTVYITIPASSTSPNQNNSGFSNPNSSAVVHTIETREIIREGGVSKAELEALRNELVSKINYVSSQNSGSYSAPSAIYSIVSQASRIDQLTNTSITTPSISGGSWSGGSFSGTFSGTVEGNQASIGTTTLKNLTVSNTSTSTFSGGVSLSSFSLTGSATSTASNGIDLSTGCFAINGACIGGSSGTVNSGTGNGLAYYASTGTTVSGTTTAVLSAVGYLGLGTTSPYTRLAVAGTVVADNFVATSTSLASVFPYASSTVLTVSGISFLSNILATASSTLQNFTAVNSTSTSATSTNFFSTTASSTNLFSTSLNTGNITSTGAITSVSLSLTSALPVSSGGTGAANIGASQLLSTNSSGNIVSTSTPTAAVFNATSTSATSTFAGGLQAGALNITSTSATSTFSRGIDLSGGCFAINGTCIGGGGSGTVTSVDASGGTTGLTFSGGPITTSGTLNLAGTLAVTNGGTGWEAVQSG
ncbi:MAG: hypothetical protein AAB597_01785, partial [Patescibacteria group bacterium]